MCYYRLCIFLGCGHSTTSSRPVSTCTGTKAHTKRNSKTPATASRHDSGIFSLDGELGWITDAIEECTPELCTIPEQPNADTSNPTQPSQNQDTPEPSRKEDVGAGGEKKVCRKKLFHPYQTYHIERMCSPCTHRRSKLLAAACSDNEVTYEGRQRRVKYQSAVQEDSSRSKWGAMGEAMGSWVKDWKSKGDELRNVLKKSILEDRSEDTGDGGVGSAEGSIGSGRSSENRRGGGARGF